MNSAQVERAAELLFIRGRVRELLASPPLGHLHLGRFRTDAESAYHPLEAATPRIPWEVAARMLQLWDELCTSELKDLGLKED